MTDKPNPFSSPHEMRYPDDTRMESFNAWDPAITEKIDQLVKLAAVPEDGEDTSDLVREIIVTALKSRHSRLDRGDVKILSRSLRELRYGFRVFKPYRHKRKVTIFGSARSREHDADYHEACRFAREMVRHGFMVITGAGPGIMRAGNEGAGPENSFGVNIQLPFEQQANEFVHRDERFIDCHFFFTRKLMFIKETSAAAFFPGGFGTHDEGMETLTLVQTGKCDPMPIVFVDGTGSGYWRDWAAFVDKHLVRSGKISPEDRGLFRITDTVEEAVEEVLHFYRNYHSLRYVRDVMSIRLLQGLSGETLETLNRDFKDICKGGGFVLGQALPEERAFPKLKRLIFPFNRHDYGRLRQLIDVLNNEPPTP